MGLKHLDALSASERRTSLIAAISSVSIAGIGFGLTFPLLSLTLSGHGISDTMIGLNASMFAIATLTFSPIVPRLVAYSGTFRFLCACLVVCIASLLAFNASTSLWLWFPLRYILGASIAGIFVVSEIWIIKIAPLGNRGKLIGIYAMSLSIGFAIGPAILLVTGTIGWLPFLVGAGSLLIASLPLIFARHVMPTLDDKSTKSVLHFVMLAPAALGAGALYGGIIGAANSFLPLYGLRTNFNDQTMPLMLVVFGLGSIVCQPFLGWGSDKFPKRTLLGLCALVCCICTLALPWASAGSLALSLVILFFFGGMVAGAYTVGLASIGDQFDGADLATANAALVAMVGFGELGGPVLAGASMDLWDPHGLAYAMAAMAGFYILFTLWRHFRGAN